MLRPTSLGRTLFLAALPSAAAATVALACPPSLTVHRPTGPGSAGNAGAVVLVRPVHGCHPGPLTVSGTAEGLIGQARRTITLELAPADTPGVYVVRRQWPREGVWVLRLTVTEGDGHATALVGIDASGNVATIREPGRRGEIREPSDGDVAALLHRLAAG